MSSGRGNAFLFPSSQQLPRLCLGPLKAFLSCHGAFQEPLSCLERRFQNYAELRTPSLLAREGGCPWTPSRMAHKNLANVFVKTYFFTAIHDCKCQQRGIDFLTKPENHVHQRGSSGGQPHPPPLVGVGSSAGRVGGAPTSLAELRLMEQQQIQQKADFFSEVR